MFFSSLLAIVRVKNCLFLCVEILSKIKKMKRTIILILGLVLTAQVKSQEKTDAMLFGPFYTPVHCPEGLFPTH